MRGAPKAALAIAAALFIALIAARPAPAAPTARLGKVTYSPPDFLVGMTVTATVDLVIDGGEPEGFTLAPGAGLPAPTADADPELRSASLAKGSAGWVLSLVFVPWSPGPGRLPSMLVGSLRSPEIRYVTASVLEGKGGTAEGSARDLSPPRAQRDPPGTTLYLYGFLLLVATILFIIIAFYLWVLPGARALLARWKRREAWVAFSRTLDWLETNGGSGDAAPFYALLSRALRLYLSRRCIDGAEALTPGEFSALPPSRLPDPGFGKEVSRLLGEADLARFAGLPFAAQARLAALRRARELAKTAEEGADVRA
jgi:hypothetical protein